MRIENSTWHLRRIAVCAAYGFGFCHRRPGVGIDISNLLVSGSDNIQFGEVTGTVMDWQ